MRVGSSKCSVLFSAAQFPPELWPVGRQMRQRHCRVETHLGHSLECSTIEPHLEVREKEGRETSLSGEGEGSDGNDF